MSHYSRSNVANERFQRARPPRRDSTGVEGNANGNNSNEVSRGLESYISNYTRSTEYAHRTSSNRLSSGLRKSNLVGSMKATFEQLNKDSLPPTSPSSLKSSSYNRVESATTIGQKSSNSQKLENGTTAPPSTKSTTPSKLENGTTPKTEIDDEDAERPSARPKSSSSARRGKQQREKRMLRQKRRSTGVVRLTDDGEEEEGKKEGTNKNEAKEDDSRKSETEKNTLSNEFSPPPSANSVRESERTRHRESSDYAGVSSVLKSSLKTSTTSISSSPYHAQQSSDSVFISGESSPQSRNVPVLNSSRRRGKRSSDEKPQQETNEKREIDDLREKLAEAETTITKMTQEVQDLKDKLDTFSKEKERLEHENKMLEDENSSMLMVLRQLHDTKRK